MSTKLFKSAIDGFGKLTPMVKPFLVSDNKIIQRDEIDLRSFNSYTKTPTKISNAIDFNFDPESGRILSDCNNKVSPLNSEEVRLCVNTGFSIACFLVSKNFRKTANGLIDEVKLAIDL